MSFAPTKPLMSLSSLKPSFGVIGAIGGSPNQDGA